MNQRNSLILYSISWLCWLIFSFSYWRWFFTGLGSHFDLLQGLLLLAVLFFWFKKSKSFPLNFKLKSNYWALGLTLVSLLGFAFVKSQTTINIFGFFTAVSMAYGLLGFILPKRSWQQGLIPFGLLLMTLPFGRHLDVFIGYPLRMLSVKAAFSSLQPLLPDLSTMSSLLVIENRASHVDMDCSGLKGLWVATLLYFLISWLEAVKISLRWLAGLAGLWLYLMLGNFLRIVVLSIIHLYWQQPALDPWVHHSLSVFFLLSGTGLAYGLLHRLGGQNLAVRPVLHSPEGQGKTIWPLGFIALAFAATLWLPAFKDKAQPSVTSPIKVLLEKKGWRASELRPAEQRVYAQEGVVGYKFTKGANELIVVLNGDWRSQHKPELCYELSGLPLASIKTHWVEKDFPLRVMHFKNRPEKAFYWFQSGAVVTDDFADKVWRQVNGSHQNWTQISMLNQNGQLPLPEVREIYSLLKSYQND